jgi:hypothetical protein
MNSGLQPMGSWTGRVIRPCLVLTKTVSLVPCPEEEMAGAEGTQGRLAAEPKEPSMGVGGLSIPCRLREKG